MNYKDENKNDEQLDENKNDEQLDKNEENSAKEKVRTKTNTKVKHRTKVKYKKQKPKTKIVYRDRNNSHGFLIFLLILIILGLIGVIGYLVYKNYYKPSKEETKPSTQVVSQPEEKTCEANTTMYTLDIGLNKCQSSKTFKLNVKGTPLSFMIKRTDNYLISDVYYNDVNIYPSVLNVSFDSMKIEKINDDYFIWIKGDNEYLSSIYNGKVNYESRGYNYNISSNISYEIKSDKDCDYYKENNLLEDTIKTKVDLEVSNGIVNEKKTEIQAKDECN